MINFAVVFDNEDKELGGFFKSGKDDLITYISNTNSTKHIVKQMDSRMCDSTAIQNQINKINSNKFIFIVYSHGNESALISNGKAFISTANSNLFANSFFYSVSCLVGKDLGADLIKQGCLAFIGYKDEFQICRNDYSVTAECAHIGIKMFLDGETIRTAYDRMRSFYTHKLTKLVRFNDFINASSLRENRDNLVLIGNENLKIDDFHCV